MHACFKIKFKLLCYNSWSFLGNIIGHDGHNSENFGALLKNIIGNFKSIIYSGLVTSVIS